MRTSYDCDCKNRPDLREPGTSHGVLARKVGRSCGVTLPTTSFYPYGLHGGGRPGGLYIIELITVKRFAGWKEWNFFTALPSLSVVGTISSWRCPLFGSKSIISLTLPLGRPCPCRRGPVRSFEIVNDQITDDDKTG